MWDNGIREWRGNGIVLETGITNTPSLQRSNVFGPIVC